jgi:hypothetical protein
MALRTSTKNGLVPENHWYEEMVGVKVEVKVCIDSRYKT